MTTVRRLRSAFTLIELLVVIAIIGLLAAILFPVFGRARESARRSSCQSNMRQIGLSLVQYTQDFDERFPSGTKDFGAYGGRGWAWQLMPYIKNRQIYTCPSDTTKALTGRIALSYIYNYSLARTNGSANEEDVQTLAKLTAPSKTVVLAEMRAGSYDYTAYEADSPTTTLAATYDANIYTVTGPIPGAPASESCSPFRRCLWDDEPRHLSGANYLAADGHVKWFPPTAISPGIPAKTPTSVQSSTGTGMSAEGTQLTNGRQMTMSPM